MKCTSFIVKIRIFKCNRGTTIASVVKATQSFDLMYNFDLTTSESPHIQYTASAILAKTDNLSSLKF